MNREDLLDQLSGRALGRPLKWFDVTDSTNTQAVSAVMAGQADHGAVFIAGRQTAGRGTDGHSWDSSEPVGLWMSIVLREQHSASPELTLMPAIAVAKVLREKWGIDAHLKWPNDVLVGDRKIAGILVESIVQAGGVVHVVGIGVNLNQTGFSGELKATACSGRMVLDRVLPLPIFFGQLVAELESWWRRPQEWVQAWSSLTAMIGRRAELIRSGSAQTVQVMGLTPLGHLLVRDEMGEETQVISRSGLDVRLPSRNAKENHEDAA